LIRSCNLALPRGQSSLDKQQQVEPLKPTERIMNLTPFVPLARFRRFFIFEGINRGPPR